MWERIPNAGDECAQHIKEELEENPDDKLSTVLGGWLDTVPPGDSGRVQERGLGLQRKKPHVAVSMVQPCAGADSWRSAARTRRRTRARAATT